MSPRQLPWKNLHFIGIGGVGMTGLALICRDLGVTVRGSDKVASKNVDLLRGRGAEVAVGHDAAHVQSPDLVVYSSAVDSDNPEYAAAVARGLPLLLRGEFLAVLAPYWPTVVSIAGSHGKTTVTAMLAHILLQAGHEPGYLIGGAVPSLPAAAAAGAGALLVTEVDESDGTQAAMRSSHAIVINAEDDHCWSVGGEAALRQCFQTFAGNAAELLCYATAETHELFDDHPNVTFIDVDAIKVFDLLVPGRHNRINATLAVCQAVKLGVAESAAIDAVGSFQGVDRRLSLRYSGAVDVIEDYAHHPSEVEAGIAALREHYVDRPLRIVFQPHRFERVARYAAAFGRALSAADDVIVIPTFNAWLDDAHLADPRAIIGAISGVPVRYCDFDFEELAAELVSTARDGDVIAIMGAGTVTQLTPLLTAELATNG